MRWVVPLCLLHLHYQYAWEIAVIISSGQPNNTYSSVPSFPCSLSALMSPIADLRAKYSVAHTTAGTTQHNRLASNPPPVATPPPPPLPHMLAALLPPAFPGGSAHGPDSVPALPATPSAVLDMIEAWAHGAYLEVKSQLLQAGQASPLASPSGMTAAGGLPPPSPLLLAALHHQRMLAASSTLPPLPAAPFPLSQPVIHHHVPVTAATQTSPARILPEAGAAAGAALVDNDEPFSIRRVTGDSGWGSSGGGAGGEADATAAVRDAAPALAGLRGPPQGRPAKISPSDSGGSGAVAASTSTPSTGEGGGGSIVCEISARCSMDFLPPPQHQAGIGAPQCDVNDGSEEEEADGPAAFQFSSIRASSSTPTTTSITATATVALLPSAAMAGASTGSMLPLQPRVASFPLQGPPDGAAAAPTEYWRQRLEQALQQQHQHDRAPGPTAVAAPSGGAAGSTSAQQQSRRGGGSVGYKAAAAIKLGCMEACTSDASPPPSSRPRGVTLGGSAAATDPEADALPTADNLAAGGVNSAHALDAPPASVTADAAAGRPRKLLKGLRSKLGLSRKKAGEPQPAVEEDGCLGHKKRKPSFWSAFANL